jgi:putative transposase
MPDLGVKTTRRAVYKMTYHAVWIPRYRKCVLIDAVADRRRGLMSEVAHLFFSAPPAIAPAPAIQGFKGLTAHRLFAGFSPLRRLLRRGHPWAPSFYVGTGGKVSGETIRRSIERTEHIRARR